MNQHLGCSDGAATESSALRAVDASDGTVAPLPRRRVLRALPGVVVGFFALAGLAACGGEDEDDEDDEDD